MISPLTHGMNPILWIAHKLISVWYQSVPHTCNLRVNVQGKIVVWVETRTLVKYNLFAINVTKKKVK